MKAALPHAEIVVIEGTGHAAHLERPEAVAAAIG
jgi:pimeloyl-ACP methyl ester carboxylesterase